MNNTNTDNIVNKIRKLLALATSDNQAESELAMTKAKKLAAEHFIDISLIRIYEGKRQDTPIEKANLALNQKRKSVTQKFVSLILQEHFHVKLVYVGTRNFGMSLAIIGTKENIEMATYVNGYLNEVFMRLWRDYRAKTQCPLNYRNPYFTGLYRGLSAKLQAEQKAVENEKLGNQPDNIKQSFALMVVSENDRLEKAKQNFFSSLKKTTVNYSGDYSGPAMNDGFEAGQTIKISKAIGYNTPANSLTA